MPPKSKPAVSKKPQKSKAEPEVPKESQPEAKGRKFKPGQSKKSQGTLESFVISDITYDTGDGKIDKDVIKISSWNVNGLRSVLNKKPNEIENYIAKEKPDIFCLNETKIDKDVLEADQIGNKMPKGYYQYWNCCKCSKGYSGVAILSQYKPLSVKADIGVPEHDQEGRTLTLEFEKFYLISCYVPNAGEKDLK